MKPEPAMSSSPVKTLLLAALCAVAVAISVAQAKKRVQLEGASVVSLPVDAQQSDSVTFDGPPGVSVTVAGKQSGRRSAGQGREDGESTLTVASPATLKVGPGQKYSLPSEAAKAARDGDTVEIAAGVYAGDVARWYANDLTIRAVGGRAHMDAGGRAQGGKAIWVISGDNAVVENIEFSNCRVPHRNGAGIRLQGRHLTVRNSYFHDNQMGILTANAGDSDILIEGSEFARNTVNYEQTRSLGHNIYIGRSRSFILRNSYVHGAKWGHNVKTRARENHLSYNRIVDGRGGSASYLVDIAEGGRALLIGNVIQQGAQPQNASIVSFGAEKRHAADRLALVNNTIINDHTSGIFVHNRSPAKVLMLNNILAGHGNPGSGPVELRNNLIVLNVSARLGDTLRGSIDAMPASDRLAGNFVARLAGFTDPGDMNFELSVRSPARDIGIDPGFANGWPLRPTAHYVHPLRQIPRPDDGRIDIGAYEYSPVQSAR